MMGGKKRETTWENALEWTERALVHKSKVAHDILGRGEEKLSVGPV